VKTEAHLSISTVLRADPAAITTTVLDAMTNIRWKSSRARVDFNLAKIWQFAIAKQTSTVKLVDLNLK
jgi:hypothetical protein